MVVRGLTVVRCLMVVRGLMVVRNRMVVRSLMLVRDLMIVRSLVVVRDLMVVRHMKDTLSSPDGIRLTAWAHQLAFFASVDNAGPPACMGTRSTPRN